MAILPSNKALRSDLWTIRVKRESSYGVEATTVSSSGESLGLLRDFNPPEATAQMEKVRFPRNSNFMPIGGVINEAFDRGSVRNWVAAYPKSFELVGGINDAILTNSCFLVYALGDIFTTVTSPDVFKKSMVERVVLPSFTLEAIYFNQSGNPADNLKLRYIGCKIDTLTINASEGKPITYSAKIIAKEVKHNIAEVAVDSSQQEWLGFDPALEAIEGVDPLDLEFGQDAYFFSGGKIEIYEPAASDSSPEGGLQNPTYGRIKNFTLTINNNLTPEYYIQNLHTFGEPSLTEIVEGYRDYRLQVMANADDQDFFRLLMQYGYYGAERRGYGIRIRYDRPLLGEFQGNDYMEFLMPAPTKIAGRNWDAFDYGSSNPTGPISGFESQNPVIGCFLVSAPHNVGYDNSLIDVPLEFEVPSLGVVAQSSAPCVDFGFSSLQSTPPSDEDPFSNVPVWIIYEV